MAIQTFKCVIAVAFLSLSTLKSGQATDLNVDFVANVLETTCNISLEQDGNININNDGMDNYSLKIPDVRLEKVINADVAAQADFKLVATGCSANVMKITTRIFGSSISGALINNEATGDAASHIGMGFKRRNSEDSAFILPNNSDAIQWSADEMSNGLPMTVALRETTAGAGTIGSFRAKATFNFTYE
ncbi:fimbrial protein [Enterobacteriaceae bacterium G50]|nr:fimbrial protein [Enterobacteriaceae bacterium G50]